MNKSINKLVIDSILFLIFFLPYYSLFRGIILIHFPEPVSSIFNLFRDLIIITLFIISLKKSVLNNIKLDKVSFLIFVLLAWLTITFFITLLRGYPKIALQAAHLTIIPILIFFAAKSGQKSHPLFFDKFLNVFSVFGLIVGILSTYFYFFRPQIYLNLFEVLFNVGGETNENIALSYVRMMGPFFSPNVFGNFMATVGIISFVNIVKKNKTKLNWLIFFISIVNVILSFSRGSWLFVVGGLLVVIFFLKGGLLNILKFFIITLSALFLGISSLTYSSSIDLEDVLKNRFNSFTDEESDAFSRFERYDEVIFSIKKYPFGAGLGAGSQASTGEANYINEIGIDVIDSYYLKLLAEGGIFGFSLFLFSMFYIILLLVRKIYWNNIKSFKDKRGFNLISLAIITGTLLQSIGSNPLDYVATAPFFWIFIGISSEFLKYEKY